MSKIYYHGSNIKFNKFDKSKIKENKLGLVFNFTDDINIAYQYGDYIIKAHLDLKNPLTLDIWNNIFPFQWYNKFGKLFTNEPDYEYDKEDYEKHPWTFGDMYNTYKMEPEFIQVLEEMGYDGIVIPEDHHFGVFESEQIHLIDDITETVQSVDRHTYVIDDTEQLVKHLKRKGLAQRIVYDKNKNWYLVSSNDQLTHPLIIEQVYNDAFYGFDVNIYQYIDKGYIREKGSNTQKPVYLYNFLYTPNTEIFTNFFDGIDHAYSYDDFGCIYTKGFDITEIPLGENLKEPQQIKENYMTELQELLEKLNKFVIEPPDKSFDEMEDETGMNKIEEESSDWRVGVLFKKKAIDVNEEASFSALGTAPTPGVKVNGNPVQGQSVKKKGKKDETVIDLSLDDIIEAVEDTFNPQDVLVTEIKNNREHIRVQVGYTNPEDNLLTHTILLMYLDEAGNVLDTQQEEDLSIQDTVEELQHLKRNHTQVEVILESDVRKINKTIESYIKE